MYRGTRYTGRDANIGNTIPTAYDDEDSSGGGNADTGMLKSDSESRLITQ